MTGSDRETSRVERVWVMRSVTVVLVAAALTYMLTWHVMPRFIPFKNKVQVPSVVPDRTSEVDDASRK